MNWFSMSRITCFNIFSGFSALSMRSFRLARTSVATRSSNVIRTPCSKLSLSAISFLLIQKPPDARLLFRPCVRGRTAVGAGLQRFRTRRLVSDGSDLAQQIRHVHARQRLEQSRNLGGHFSDVA